MQAFIVVPVAEQVFAEGSREPSPLLPKHELLLIALPGARDRLRSVSRWGLRYKKKKKKKKIVCMT